jgi:hypothetical protein
MIFPCGTWIFHTQNRLLAAAGILSTKTAEIVDIYIVVANSEASSPADCKNQESIFT